MTTSNIAPRPTPIVETRGVTRRFGGLVAVDDASLTVARGGITGLIGPNGAGKSTLFSLIAGSLAPSQGEILIDAQPGHKGAAHERISMGLARTFQIPKPFPAMTVLENVLVSFQRHPGEKLLRNWLSPRSVAREECENVEKAHELIKFVALGRLADQPARVLSGGQRKLLELARVLATKPSVILLDEPAAGVNPTLLETIIDRIGELNSRGMSFLLIEHNMDMVTRLCHDVYAMARGKVLCHGTPQQVTADPRVIESYLGGTL
ncbi:Lipopolysaccharide export system ATP-binding protein LptB (plasmid) [Caballeronia sp. SBC1]|uniref:ABC transporter ATP-binding protein n=1 Tax=Caballeronia sp. SBC1 TaxID=2705548 RepID=UPI00140CE628|nr:ABC transporter ATP-binding protein [Caballeronia sp. SBC1]QIN67937.1 Lipopolysaccharide export system ATP-binding protein LptB [Caballeronia sp. SBC1]